MRKCNLEKKIDLAIDELMKGYKLDEILPFPEVARKYHIERALSILMICDDYILEDNGSGYCLSELERNFKYYDWYRNECKKTTFRDENESD